MEVEKAEREKVCEERSFVARRPVEVVANGNVQVTPEVERLLSKVMGGIKWQT
jgi:hypothetical protein